MSGNSKKSGISQDYLMAQNSINSYHEESSAIDCEMVREGSFGETFYQIQYHYKINSYSIVLLKNGSETIFSDYRTIPTEEMIREDLRIYSYCPLGWD